MQTTSVCLTIIPIVLSALLLGCSRGFFFPRRGPPLFPGTIAGTGKVNNDTDAIVIENTGDDGDNDTSHPFIPRFHPITPPSTCPPEQSCRNRCSTARQFQNINITKGKDLRCFCDPECNTIFNDCCADYERYCQETGAQRAEGNLLKSWECDMFVGKDVGIWMIKTCSLDWPSDETRSRCKNSSSEVALKEDPTLIVDEFNNIFKNRYCAKCNDVQKFTCLTLQVKNASSQNVSNRQPRLSTMNRDRSLQDECPRVKNSSTIGLRYCYKIQNSCKNTADNSTTARICHSGKTALVSFKNKTYKNFHCLKCHHQVTFGFIPARVSCGPHYPADSRFNFATMFRNPGSLYTDKARCSEGSFYDNTARACRRLLTVSELSLNDSSILTSYTIRLRYTRNQKLACFGYKNPAKDNKTVILSKILSEFNKAFRRKIELNLRNTDWTLSNIAIHADDANYNLTTTFRILAIKADVNETELFSPVKDFQLGQIHLFYNLYNASSLCSYSLSVETSRKMKCLAGNHSNVAITMDKVSIFDNGTLYHRPSEETFNQGEYVLFKRHNQTRFASCRKSMPTNCKYILKSDSNWKLFANRSIYSHVTNSWFEFGEYSIIDGVVWLCLTDELPSISKQKEQSETIHETILRYSSLCCLSISILSLIVLLVVYAITPAMRNLPGKNLMLLCCVLALAQFLWLLQEQASKFHKACIILSTLLHFLFLASFSSATSIAFLTYNTFHAIANGKLARSNERKAFLRYALFSLGFPCLWVTLFFLLDHYEVFSLAYGSVKDHCWLGTMKGFYVSFFAPLFTLLCINLALLLATVNMIRKCSKSSQKLAKSGPIKSADKRHVWIYIRMASLMGFTWLLGVFQLVLPRVLVFEYLFVFVNGFQGFYIALAFLCTDNVKKMLRKGPANVSGKTKSTSK